MRYEVDSSGTIIDVDTPDIQNAYCKKTKIEKYLHDIETSGKGYPECRWDGGTLSINYFCPTNPYEAIANGLSTSEYYKSERDKYYTAYTDCCRAASYYYNIAIDCQNARNHYQECYGYFNRCADYYCCCCLTHINGYLDLWNKHGFSGLKVYNDLEANGRLWLLNCAYGGSIDSSKYKTNQLCANNTTIDVQQRKTVFGSLYDNAINDRNTAESNRNNCASCCTYYGRLEDDCSSCSRRFFGLYASNYVLYGIAAPWECLYKESEYMATSDRAKINNVCRWSCIYNCLIWRANNAKSS